MSLRGRLKDQWKGQDQTEAANSVLLNTTNEAMYVERPPASCEVLLKLTKVLLRNGGRTMETSVILDNGSECTILLHEHAQQLGSRDNQRT